MTDVDRNSLDYLAGHQEGEEAILAQLKVKKKLTLDDVRKMTPEQILARKANVDAVLSGGES